MGLAPVEDPAIVLLGGRLVPLHPLAAVRAWDAGDQW